MFSIRKNGILNSLEIFDHRKSPANKFPLLSPNVNNNIISTQTENHMHRKSVATGKSTLFKKWI